MITEELIHICNNSSKLFYFIENRQKEFGFGFCIESSQGQPYAAGFIGSQGSVSDWSTMEARTQGKSFIGKGRSHAFAIDSLFIKQNNRNVARNIGVSRCTMQHYVSKDRVILQVRHSVITLVVFIIAFSFCGTALPNMLYIPALALVAITVSVLLYVLHRNSRLDKTIRTPLIVVAVAGVLALSFVTDVNSYYCSAVDTHIREQLAQECTEITLPCAPYATRIVPITEAQLSEYYDFPSHGEVKITYVPFEKWDWITYYDAHNVPVIQEYDEDAVETEDWAFEFEED